MVASDGGRQSCSNSGGGVVMYLHACNCRGTGWDAITTETFAGRHNAVINTSSPEIHLPNGSKLIAAVKQGDTAHGSNRSCDCIVQQWSEATAHRKWHD
jgi:hypothetical protein